jgi:hypothetical protein
MIIQRMGSKSSKYPVDDLHDRQININIQLRQIQIRLDKLESQIQETHNALISIGSTLSSLVNVNNQKTIYVGHQQ